MHPSSTSADSDRAILELSPGQARELAALLSTDALKLDIDARAACGGDESPLPPVRPAAVVFAAHTADVAATLAFAHREGIPVTPRGAGSGKVGGAIPIFGGIVLVLAPMNRIIEIAGTQRLARVEPGVITGHLRSEAEARGLFYPPNPNSLDLCSIGGNIATNAAGPCSVKYGPTRNHVLGLEVVLADGSVLRLGRETTKSATGYDLTGLMVGSEGTLAVVTGITLRLLNRPTSSRTLFSTFPSSQLAIQTLSGLYQAGILPAAAEFFDRAALEAMSRSVHVPEGANAGLLFEIDGSEATIDETLERLVEVLGARAGNFAVARDQAEVRRFWDARKDVSILIKESYACRRSEDIAVPPHRLPDLTDFIQQLKEESGIDIVTYGHAGDGNLHVNFLYHDPARQLEVEAVVERLFRKAISCNGTLSGEHGIGLTKKRFMPLEQSPGQLNLQKRLKATLDPRGILNPGKIFP